ncbi:MAG: rhodanese-like domain-containing protein [Dehalococcoidia bacterium]|nr:rhodanese-like domain-containing protein [Dehalococcoidia bacterium]
MPRKEPGEPFFRISADEAAKMHGKPDVVVVDVRGADEYKAGHVKGALWIPVDDVLGRIDELPKGKKLLFICAMGQRSGLACEMAAAMGLDSDHLYNIEDGTPAWLEKKYPASYGNEP